MTLTPYRRRFMLRSAIVILGIVGAAACGSDDTNESADDTTLDSTGDTLLTDETLPSSPSSSAVPTVPVTSSAEQPDFAGVRLRVGDQAKTVEGPLTLSGQLAELPYDIEFPTFADGTQMSAALNATELDVAFMGDTPSLLATGAGADVVVVAVNPTPGGLVIVASAESGIETVEDLAGQRVAYIQGTALHGYLAEALDSVGLTQADVELVNVPGTALIATVEGGNADAVVTSSRAAAAYLDANEGAVVLETDNDSSNVLLATRAALDDPNRRAAVEDLVARLVVAGTWVGDHLDIWASEQLVAGQGMNPELAERLAESTTPVWRPVDDSFIAHQATQADLLISAGVFAPDLDPAAQLDPEVNEVFNIIIEGALE